MSVVLDRVRGLKDAYAHGEDRPLGDYTLLMAAYTTAAAGLVGAARLLRRNPPDRVGVGDVVLLTVATHKLSRLVAKDSITSPIRAPFTRYVGPAGDGELTEEVRGHGWRHGVGELLTCPFCLAVWVSTGFTAGLVFAPRVTRMVATTFAVVAGSDALQLAYDAGSRPWRRCPTDPAHVAARRPPGRRAVSRPARAACVALRPSGRGGGR